jgi:hypothetical protein
MIFRHLRLNINCKTNCIGDFKTLSFGVSYRAVLQVLFEALNWSKCLTFRLLNDIYMVVNVMKYVYLCGAKVPYYGRSTYGHRAHDNASPLQDAAGSRGIVCKGCIVV